jgi:thioredoxin 2
VESRGIECPNCGRKNRVTAAAEGIPQCGNCHQVLPRMADAGDDDFGDVAVDEVLRSEG